MYNFVFFQGYLTYWFIYFVLKCGLIVIEQLGVCFRSKRGVCGHAMASFDPHELCARCKEKVIGSDPCVCGKEPCKYCVVLTPEQILKLSIPKYKIRKEKKAEACKDMDIVDPQDVSVIKALSPLETRPSSAPVSASVTSASGGNTLASHL